MQVEQLRERYRKVPFRPFVIALDNGESYAVRHPEQIAIGDELILWSDGKRKWSMFEPEKITEVRALNGRR